MTDGDFEREVVGGPLVRFLEFCADNDIHYRMELDEMIVAWEKTKLIGLAKSGAPRPTGALVEALDRFCSR